MSDSNSGESSVLAFLLGGTIGVIAGLLLAPRSGAETREQLADWLEENREKTREFLERGREAVERGRETLGEQGERVKDAWQAGKKAFREHEREG